MVANKPRHDVIFATGSSAFKDPLLPTTKHNTSHTKKKLINLTFLDGLRGIAALMVYSHHHITEYYGNDCDLMHPYGYQDRYHFGQWRFVQPFFAGGTPAVMTFFVLSGYVLSRSVLLMVENGKSFSTIIRYLLNAFLRRPIRLWLPPILVSLPVALAFHTPLRPVGAFINIQTNIFLELRTYFMSLLETINPFIAHGPFAQSFTYSPPVWTMAYELNGSILVYVLTAMLGPSLSARKRVFALTITLFFCFEYGHFSLVCFVLGIIIAQMDVAGLDQPYLDRFPKSLRYLGLNLIFLIGWYLLSDIGSVIQSESPWFGLSAKWIPYLFYHNPQLGTNIAGACCIVYASLRLTWLQRCLSRAKWLGRVSFALYLTHVPIIWVLGLRVRRALGPQVGEADEKAFFDGMFPIPDIGPQGMTSRYIAMQVIVLPLNLLLAEAVTVWIDEPAVQLSKHFATQVTQKLHL